MSTFSLTQTALKEWGKMPPIKWKAMYIDKTIKKPDKPSTTLGSILDVICFTPSEFNKKFLISDLILPSSNIQLIIKGVYDHISALNKNAEELNAQGQDIPMKEFKLENFKSLIQIIAKEIDFWKGEARAITEVLKPENRGIAFFEQLIKAQGKKVVTQSDYDLALELKNILTTHELTKKYFKSTKGVEIKVQFRIEAEKEIEGVEGIETLPAKGFIDILVINHKKKWVMEVDLKYTNDAFLFYIPVREFDYGFQHSFYEFLIKEWMKTYDDGKIKDYTILPPKNIVIDDVNKIPYIYTYRFNDLEIKRTGIPNTPFKGWEDSIQEIAWHMATDQWLWPRSHYLNGSIELNLYNKK